jgi:hypothetical protein
MRLKAVVVGLTALGGVALTTVAASAMPNGLPQAGRIAGQTASVDQVRYVCNPWGRCFWRPNYYGSYGYRHAYGYYGYHRPYGWHRWHHWRRW